MQSLAGSLKVEDKQCFLVAQIEAKKSKNLYRNRIVTSAVSAAKSGSAVEVSVEYVNTTAICFCNNDYLGLATHPRVVEKFQQAVTIYGVGSTASPLVSGYKKIHQQFEEEFAAFVGMERALLFSSGYLANLGAITAIVGRNDLVYQDKDNHASLIDAVILARAKSMRYADLDRLRQQLNVSSMNQTRLIITESVFGMSGREAQLTQLIKIAVQARAWLLVDEAHGIGVLGEHGQGVLASTWSHRASDTLPQEIILTAPLGKAFGCSGGVVAGSSAYIEYCIQQARSYIYSTGISPAIAAASLESLHVMQVETWRSEHLYVRVRQFKAGAEALGLKLLPSNTPIQCVVIGDEEKALAISEQLLTKKIWLRAMRCPTVPMGKACLRISITTLHSESDINYLLEQLQLCIPFRLDCK